MIEVKKAQMDSLDAKELIQELNQVLTEITGDDGTANFKASDVQKEKSTFFIVYVDEKPYGCGALRKISDDVAEIKRVYARKNKLGIGSIVVQSLENAAASFGYKKILMETRVQNQNAIHFYEKNGYTHCENFGKYVGKENAYCFMKCL
ncbi:MAG: GNAT family N-acetyltransferase [Lachnospiraceae bacterium]|nr:GNAT family N-acetyltransferase [Lachnospiraceae bacterium]